MWNIDNICKYLPYPSSELSAATAPVLFTLSMEQEHWLYSLTERATSGTDSLLTTCSCTKYILTLANYYNLK